MGKRKSPFGFNGEQNCRSSVDECISEDESFESTTCSTPESINGYSRPFDYSQINDVSWGSTDLDALMTLLLLRNNPADNTQNLSVDNMVQTLDECRRSMSASPDLNPETVRHLTQVISELSGNQKHQRNVTAPQSDGSDQGPDRPLPRSSFVPIGYGRRHPDLAPISQSYPPPYSPLKDGNWLGPGLRPETTAAINIKHPRMNTLSSLCPPGAIPARPSTSAPTRHSMGSSYPLALLQKFQQAKSQDLPILQRNIGLLDDNVRKRIRDCLYGLASANVSPKTLPEREGSSMREASVPRGIVALGDSPTQPGDLRDQQNVLRLLYSSLDDSNPSSPSATSDHSDVDLFFEPNISLSEQASSAGSSPQSGRRRVFFTEEQKSKLNSYYLAHETGGKCDLDSIAREVGITAHQCRIFFQNKRARSRDKKSE